VVGNLTNVTATSNSERTVKIGRHLLTELWAKVYWLTVYQIHSSLSRQHRHYLVVVSTDRADMHQLTCGIRSLLHSVNLILFTLLLVYLVPHISPHHSHHLRSHHLSLRRFITPDLKLIFSQILFLQSHSDSFHTAFMDLEPVPD